jgi:hypothetical protein
MLFAPALLALLRARTRERWFFAGVVLFGLLAGADAPVLNDILTRIPIFNLAINARMISFGAFGICVLAAMGLQVSLTERERLAWLFLGGAATMIVLVVLIAARSTLTPDFVRANAVREIAPMLLAFALLRAFPSQRAAMAGILGLLLLQRVTEIGGFIPDVDRRAYTPPIAGFDRLPRGGAPYRIVGQGSLFAPNVATQYGLEDVRGYQAMTFARMAELFSLWSIPQAVWSNQVDDLTAPMLSLMNVRFALAIPDSPLPPAWRLVGRYPGYQLIENTGVLPRAFVPRLVHMGLTDVDRGMRACRDFSAEAWIETDGPPVDVVNGAGDVSVRAEGSRLQIHASMRTAGWLVISETAWKGWRAMIKGQSIKLHFADRAFLGMYVPVGAHDIEVTYRPHSVTTGAAISIASALVLAGFGIARRRRHAPVSSDS